jgi:hypothetical protein
MIELLLPCGFDTMEYSWVKVRIGISMVVDYSVAMKHQHYCNSWSSRGSQGQTRPRSETSIDGEAKPNVEKNPEEVAAKQIKVLGAKTETRTEAGTSS